MHSRKVVITHARRTPLGALGGALAGSGPVDLGVELAQGLLREAGIKPDQVERVWLGQARPDPEAPNVAGIVAYRAGIPMEAAAGTVTQGAASGLQAILLAAQAVRSGEVEVALAGGVDCPSSLGRLAGGGAEASHDPGGLWCALLRQPSGVAAEHLAGRYQVPPEAMLAYREGSLERARRARQDGRLEAQIFSIRGREGDASPRILRSDEYLQAAPAAAEGFPFRAAEPRVPAASVAPLADGAALVLLMSSDEARRRGIEPVIQLGQAKVTGIDPRFAGLAGVDAAHAVTAGAGIRPDSFDLVELGETFAVDALVGIEELGLDPERVNVTGGDLSLGHAFGAASARMVVALFQEMLHRCCSRGLVALSTSGGLGVAASFFHRSRQGLSLFSMPPREEQAGDPARRPRKPKR